MDDSDLFFEVFSLHISVYVKTLMKHGKFGVCQKPVDIELPLSGCASTEEKCCDRFTIHLPFAGRVLSWEVMLNHFAPEQPPDFIFINEEYFYPEAEDIKSLVKWDQRSANSLNVVLHELLEAYKEYQISLVNENSRLQFEYEALITDNGFTKEDVEVFVCRPSEHRFGQVNFLLRLPVDFSQIPSFLFKDEVEESYAVLLIMFQSPESSKCTPKLFLSDDLRNVLGQTESLKLPSYPVGAALIDYAPEVCDLLKKKVKMVCAGYEKRKTYVTAFLNAFGKSLLEYDEESFYKMSFLMEWHDFFFIFTVNISPSFPQERPVFTFQSVYHETENEEPYSKEENDYPYSPRWSPKEMCTRARTFILKNIGDFQKISITKGHYSTALIKKYTTPGMELYATISLKDFRQN